MIMIYSIQRILRAARIHPFYDPSVEYPPDQDTINHAIRAEPKSEVDISKFPLLHKQNL